MNTTARLKQAGKHFEILVDLDKALDYKKGKTNSTDFLESERIFTDLKKGLAASGADLKEAFGTEEVSEIAEKIVKKGEVLLTQEHRDEERETRLKQIVDFLANNSFDPQSRRPHTPERIKSAIEEAGIQIKNVPVEAQIREIVESLGKIIPIKIETKKIKMTIPAMYSGKVYGLASQYKENENWLSNGDLEMTVGVPAGIIMNFYDKLNSMTHGSVITEEIKE